MRSRWNIYWRRSAEISYADAGAQASSDALSRTSYYAPGVARNQKLSMTIIVLLVRFLLRDAMLARYMLWPCVCVCVTASHVGVLLKRLN